MDNFKRENCRHTDWRPPFLNRIRGAAAVHLKIYKGTLEFGATNMGVKMILS